MLQTHLQVALSLTVGLPHKMTHEQKIPSKICLPTTDPKDPLVLWGLSAELGGVVAVASGKRGRESFPTPAGMEPFHSAGRGS